ncbi:hypothetical protein AVEN_184492-1 [Araneus ventricosus]|uniref:SGNH hydrolase-type esterase domain-containing protein n=1 Tax=Araneus ventricosus TaxID=182803 RepID=A0A4Y2BGP6_ARAVE|nr:hypothetical protein AVEN_184492-1 [Araneus ventricosus]
MKVLVLGDSMIKYLSELLSQSETEVRSFPGIRIEGLTNRLSSLSLNSYDSILIHVGTNNSTEDLIGIVQNFDCLFDTILALNPKLKRRYSPPRVDTDTRVSTPISYSPCQNSGLSGAFFPRFSIPENRRVIGGSSSICVCVHMPVE